MERFIIRVNVYTCFFLMSFISFSCAQKYQEYYNDGRLKYEVELNSKDKREGVAVKYDKDGNLLQKSIWVDGEKDGETIVYYPSGIIRERVEFEQGKQNGFFLEYDTSGILIRKSIFLNNKIEGISYGYFNDGSIKEELNFENGNLNGRAIRFYSDGKKEYHDFYRNNKLIYIKKYDKLGEVIDSMLPVFVERNDNVLRVELLYTIYKNPKIGVIIGRFNSTKDQVVDTVFASQFSGVLAEIEIAKNFPKDLEGLLFEIDGDNNSYNAVQYFSYPAKPQ